MEQFMVIVFKVLFKVSGALVTLALLIAGAFIGDRFLGGDAGWLFGALYAFPVCCVILGPMLLLIRIDENVTTLRKALVKTTSRARNELEATRNELDALSDQVTRISAQRRGKVS